MDPQLDINKTYSLVSKDEQQRGIQAPNQENSTTLLVTQGTYKSSSKMAEGKGLFATTAKSLDILWGPVTNYMAIQIEAIQEAMIKVSSLSPLGQNNNRGHNKQYTQRGKFNNPSSFGQ